VLERILTGIGTAVAGSPGVALAAAFSWGVLSVLLSPCHLSSIPLVVGYLNGGEQRGFRRSLATCSLFAVGVLATIGLVGAATSALGRMAGDVGPVGNLLLAGILVAIGLVLMDLLRLPWAGAVPQAWRARGPAGALLLGLIFGAGLGPCTFAFMAPVLGVAFREGGGSFGYGASLMLAYGAGHALVIALAGASADVVQRLLTSRVAGFSVALKRLCGGLVVLAGGYLAWSTLP
jgi:cytochrome c-type biogenesis protein